MRYEASVQWYECSDSEYLSTCSWKMYVDAFGGFSSPAGVMTVRDRCARTDDRDPRPRSSCDGQLYKHHIAATTSLSWVAHALLQCVLTLYLLDQAHMSQHTWTFELLGCRSPGELLDAGVKLSSKKNYVNRVFWKKKEFSKGYFNEIFSKLTRRSCPLGRATLALSNMTRCSTGILVYGEPAIN